MDPLRPGRGLADLLPEELKASGAHGVMLNHAERPVTFAVLEKSIARAREVGLFTIVCASSIAEIKAIALLAPDIIVAEPTELIGTGTTSDLSYMQASKDAVASIDPRILVLQGAGISCADDVERVISAGADATGSSSAIALARNRPALVEQMLAAVRRGWDTRMNTHQPMKKEQPA
ncbi:triose-phosphate isomerase [Tessaracoccus sp. HDW20]|uniref:triose-phosphate isomerase n=1 Tax=Tessaracoccus coleopterorum TaxID=2714950 RepID=UPI0018D4266B|nr:triose-phosphate isomerase [Tessaracoccus coleopterorum]NHB85097.1 triose-phosphate isomerase [Tessaracoccus coleopterorum]